MRFVGMNKNRGSKLTSRFRGLRRRVIHGECSDIRPLPPGGGGMEAYSFAMPQGQALRQASRSVLTT